MNNIFQNFSKMMNNKDIPNNMKNIMNNMQKQTNSKEATNNTANASSATNDISNMFGNIDIGTIMKIQKIMQSMNDSKMDDRTNLLLSLKPYVKESRKKKVDQYVQLMKMERVFESMYPLGGENKNE